MPAQRTAARQKLSRLNNLQFHELATDVYDELMRRNVDSHSMLSTYAIKQDTNMCSIRVIFTFKGRVSPEKKSGQTKIGNTTKYAFQRSCQ